MAINLYGFKKYGCENIRTCGVNIPAEGSNSSTGTSKTYFDEASSYTIDSKTVYTIPAGSIIKFEFTAGSDVSGSEADNKIEITYVSSLGANTLTSKTYENLLNIGADDYALLAEDYTIGDRKLVYYVVDNTSNVEVR